jgi:hypothetical protein
MITDREKALWDLLDDIDTASDRFRPERSAYAEYVNRKVGERFKYLTSDGYDLYEPQNDSL